jgi:DNA invertase Pin-like site-specific DNA recombinase
VEPCAGAGGERRGAGLVVWNFSRFSRSPADAEIALRRIEAAGGRLQSESESFDTSTPEGRFARRTLFSMAEMERELAD